ADRRRRLKEAGAAVTYSLGKVKERDLAVQRFRFLSRLTQAAGHRGWVVLLDEVELIGRYSALQRAKSYAELARWVRGDRDDPGAPIIAVLTTVDDFETQVLIGKNDVELIPKRLRGKGTVEAELLAGLAESGMRIIEREQVQLQPPGRDELDRTYAQLKQIHADAYGWNPPDIAGLERLPSNRMRQYVRAWINEWDLRRLDPTYQPETTAAGLAIDLSEDTDVEAPGQVE
ncbi:MAG: BREX system ATP-binding domain-containing protein, partial [Mycobacteriales bacterium]